MAPTGSNAAPGSRAAPVQTIQHALDLAAGARPKQDVYAAAGVFAGAVTLPAGVGLYGGFAGGAAAAAARGKGSAWTARDRCDGTLTRVRPGRVAVVAKGGRTRTLRAGHALLVRARLFAARRRRR